MMKAKNTFIKFYRKNTSIEAIVSSWQNGEYILEPVPEEGSIEDLVKGKVDGKKLKK